MEKHILSKSSPLKLKLPSDSVDRFTSVCDGDGDGDGDVDGDRDGDGDVDPF